MSQLDEISSILEAAGIRHALIDALALAAYGVNRATVDLDLFAADASCLRPELWAGLRDRGVSVDIRKGDSTDPLAGVVRFQAPGESPLDVVVGKFPWQTRLLERAEPIGGLLVVRAADLVLLKLYAGGLQDAWDVQQLLARPSGKTSSTKSNRASPSCLCSAATCGRRFWPSEAGECRLGSMSLGSSTAFDPLTTGGKRLQGVFPRLPHR